MSTNDIKNAYYNVMDLGASFEQSRGGGVQFSKCPNPNMTEMPKKAKYIYIF